MEAVVQQSPLQLAALVACPQRVQVRPAMGAHPRLAVRITAKAKAVAAKDAIFDGIAAGDKKAVQEAYKEFLAVADIQEPYKGKDLEYSQGYSNEYDWKSRTNKGTIYVR